MLLPMVPATRHLLRAKDLADARYFEPLAVADLARAARLSPAHFSREFKRTFGESPHQYLLTRRLERAAAQPRTSARRPLSGSNTRSVTNTVPLRATATPPGCES